MIGKGSHLLITADLPPNQLEEQNLIKSTNESDISEAKKMNKNYDIRLKKITMKNKKQMLEEITLEINSFGKYCLTKN